MQEPQAENIPTAEELIDRLDGVDFERLDKARVILKLRNGKDYAHYYLPGAALILVLITALLTLLGLPIWGGFIFAAALVVALAVGIDQNNRQIESAAEQQMRDYIRQIETQEGLMKHFVRFMPQNFHLTVYQVFKGYPYDLDRYVWALTWLRDHLNRPAFVRYWNKKHGILEVNLDPALANQTPPPIARA